MARVAKRLHEQFHLPVIPQEELVMADPTLPYLEIAGGSRDGKSTMQWNTYEVAKFQANICKARNWKTVIVVVAPMHAGGYYHPENQTFTLRGPWRLFIREILCRYMFLFLGKMRMQRCG
jgi:hypothetical protein